MTSMDISDTIVADSTQVNAVDLAEPVTVTITKVSRGNEDQPVNLFLAEFPGKALRPCKTVRRVLVAAWGKDASRYIGRQMTIYNDTSVRWGGQQVGGVRVSALSHIQQRLVLNLPEARGKLVRVTVEPLTEAQAATEPTEEQVAASTSTDVLSAMWKVSGPEMRARIEARATALKAQAAADGPMATRPESEGSDPWAQSGESLLDQGAGS